MHYSVRFPYASFDFISIYLFVPAFAMKLKDASCKSYWTILAVCDQWKMISDLNMSHRQMSDFVLFPLFGFTLLIKLRNFDFESQWNILKYFLIKRYGVRFGYVLWKNVWFSSISIVSVHFCHNAKNFNFERY